VTVFGSHSPLSTSLIMLNVISYNCKVILIHVYRYLSGLMSWWMCMCTVIVSPWWAWKQAILRYWFIKFRHGFCNIQAYAVLQSVKNETAFIYFYLDFE
jgi:hypothetical protein